MYFRIIFNTLLILALIVFQLGFVKGLPGWLNAVNLMAIVLVFLVSLARFRTALGWAIGMGVLLDVYSFLPFGVHILVLVGCVYLLRFLIVNFFTNRSLYAFLGLIFFAFIGYELMLYGLGYAAFGLGLEGIDWDFGTSFWWHELGGLVMNGVAVTLVFYVLNLISNTLRPVFLFSLAKGR